MDETEQPPAWFTEAKQLFAPGDHVRVRVNLECLYCCDPQFKACYDRARADDGRTGTVYDVGHGECSCRWVDEPDPEHQAHDVWVKWDGPRPYDEPKVRIGDWECPFDAHFASEELEVIVF